MVGALKAVLIAIISAVALMMITQLAFFFPFYMTIVVETFNLSNIAANNNYVGNTYYNDSLYGLKSRPIFNKSPSDVTIEVSAKDRKGYTWRAIGDDNEFAYNGYDDGNGGHLLSNGAHKPYTQRGNPITVTISAVYPVDMTLWGRSIRFRVPVSFSITSIGLKYYKDLEMESP